VPTLSEFWSNSKKYGTFIIADYGRFWQIMPDFDRIYQILVWQILARKKDKISASPRLWEPMAPALFEFWAIHNLAH